MTKGNSSQQAATGAQDPGQALSGLGRVRAAARRDKTQRFTSLMHHITLTHLTDSFYRLRKDARAGVDEVTWRAYEKTLDKSLPRLHEAVQSGRYRAQPSKRIYIPKDDGRLRPIGIAALEDKIVQAAVACVLENIYEEDFLNFSHGFRPGRSQHNALDAVTVGIERRKINWILDADLSSFFDTIDHDWMLRMLEHRIADRRIVRLIAKWLRAGVSEDGEWSPSRVGTPQGAVISPFLANIFLHYALDLWTQRWRERVATGDMIIVRYADDFIVGFQHRRDAEAFQTALAGRLAKFNLALNTDKTRLIEFGRFAADDRKRRGEGKPETFDFLGFTHMCGKTRARGRFTVRRKPIAKRLRKKLREIKTKLMAQRHDPVPEQGAWLRSVLAGYFQYFAVPGTSQVLDSFRKQACLAWFKALRRRSDKARRLTWERMERLLRTWIPPVKIVHPYPDRRLRV